MKKENHFNDSWKFWIWDNVQRGVTKKELAKTLLEKGFSKQLIIDEFNLPYIFEDDVLFNVNTDRLIKRFNAEQLSDQFNIFKIKNVLNQEQCQKLIEIIKQDCKRSSVIDYVAGNRMVSDFRTSSTTHLLRENDSVIGEVEDLICDIVGIPEAYSEPLQGQFYKEGEQFKPHFDTFFEVNEEIKKLVTLYGNRTWTAMIYLNNTEKGGHTRFTEIDIEAKPEMGCMILWQNTEYGININESKHWGMPIEKGEKLILTKWFREKPFQTNLL